MLGAETACHFTFKLYSFKYGITTGFFFTEIIPSFSPTPPGGTHICFQKKTHSCYQGQVTVQDNP